MLKKARVFVYGMPFNFQPSLFAGKAEPTTVVLVSLGRRHDTSRTTVVMPTLSIKGFL